MNSLSESSHCDICKTRQLTNGVWECLSENPQLCPNALEFGFSHHICRHPEPHTFTKDDKSKSERPEDGDA